MDGQRPIGFDGGDTNLYGYVLQDTVNLVDPEGLAPPSIRPDWVNMCSNGEFASTMSLLQFYMAIRSDRFWDYKRIALQYENFGNYNFGYVAAAKGFSLTGALSGAGLYQIYSGTSQWSWYSSYFDDPNDQ